MATVGHIDYIWNTVDEGRKAIIQAFKDVIDYTPRQMTYEEIEQAFYEAIRQYRKEANDY